MTAMPAALVLEDIRLELAGRPLLGPLSLTVQPGEIVTLMGPSGCGKSSLLAYICGTLDPAIAASGRIALNGLDLGGLPPELRGIGILFQDDLLFPHMTVGENLAFALPRDSGDRRERRQLIDSALEEAGLAGFAPRDPATLSGGQRARVALLRTLLSQPRALSAGRALQQAGPGFAIEFQGVSVRPCPRPQPADPPGDPRSRRCRGGTRHSLAGGADDGA